MSIIFLLLNDSGNLICSELFYTFSFVILENLKVFLLSNEFGFLLIIIKDGLKYMFHSLLNIKIYFY